MANASYGWAQLDLAGNRITWSASDTQHNKILLEGWHFQHVVPMATLAISSLCLLSFFALLISVCAVYCGHRDTSKFLPWHSVWVPLFCMMGYFASDITNRIFHELERTEPWEYIGINVVIGSLASIADGLLMVYLLNRSPVSIQHAGRIGALAMILAIVVYWIIGTASKGTQIWNLVVQNSAPAADGSGDNTTPSILTKSQAIFQDLDTVASSMQLLFAIGFAILSRRYLHHLSQTGALRKRLSFAVSTLAIAFLVRNAVKFAFALVYSQLHKIASLGVQLVYMAIYGPLSAVIFACIVSIAAVRGKENDGTTSTAATSTSYHKVPQQTTASLSEPPDDRSSQYQYQYQHQQRSPYQGKAGVMMSAYPATQNYEAYG